VADRVEVEEEVVVAAGKPYAADMACFAFLAPAFCVTVRLRPYRNQEAP